MNNMKLVLTITQTLMSSVPFSCTHFNAGFSEGSLFVLSFQYIKYSVRFRNKIRFCLWNN